MASRNVRNTSYTWMRLNRGAEPAILFDENTHLDSSRPSSEAELLPSARRDSLEFCLRELPVECREVIVMRELEGLSYRESVGNRLTRDLAYRRRQRMVNLFV